jgi:hypothetical protein
VPPFRLTNAPATFQDMMNHILKGVLDKGVFDYIGDIIIYVINDEMHDKLLKKVLERLAKDELVISPEKSNWTVKEVEFLGYIITPEGMRMANPTVTKRCTVIPVVCKLLQNVYTQVFQSVSSLDRIYERRQPRLAVGPRNGESHCKP